MLESTGSVSCTGTGWPWKTAQRGPSPEPSVYLFVVIESNHAHMGIRGQGGRGCAGIDQGLVYRGIESIILTPSASVTQPTNTLELPIPTSDIMAAVKGACAFTGLHLWGHCLVEGSGGPF